MRAKVDSFRGQMDTPITMPFSLPLLEVPCKNCGGTGKVRSEELRASEDCWACGCGYVPTEEGLALIRFLRHHSSVKADLSFAVAS